MPQSRFVRVLVLLLAILAVPLFTLAREGGFHTAVGELSSSHDRFERVMVGEAGRLIATNYDGTEVLSGFPVGISGGIAASSPIVADFDGDGNAEIAVLTRNISNAYSLNIYTSTGTLYASTSLGGLDIYCDIVGVQQSDGTAGIAIARDNGEVLVATVESGSISTETVVVSGTPRCVAWDELTNELIVSHPMVSRLDVFVSHEGSWSLDRSLTLSAPVVYAVTPWQGSYYVVTNVNRVQKIDSTNGIIQDSFDYFTLDRVIDRVVVDDIDPDSAGDEVVVPLYDGTTVLLSTTGSVLDSEFTQTNAKGIYSPTIEDGTGVIQQIGQAIVRGVTSVSETVVSLWADIKFFFQVTPGDPVVLTDGTSLEGWSITDDDPIGSTLALENVGGTLGSVVRHTPARHQFNAFTYDLPDSGGLTQSRAYLGWDMRSDSGADSFVDVSIQITDNDGWRYFLIYQSGEGYAVRQSSSETYEMSLIYYPIGDHIDDGQWHTVVRDLNADLKAFFPDVSIDTFGDFVVKHNGAVDNVTLYHEDDITHVHGTVALEDDTPVEGIGLRFTRDSDEETFYVQSDASGHFHFHTLEGGPFTVTAETGAYDADIASPVVSDGEVVQNITLTSRSSNVIYDADVHTVTEEFFTITKDPDDDATAGINIDSVTDEAYMQFVGTGAIDKLRFRPPTGPFGYDAIEDESYPLISFEMRSLNDVTMDVRVLLEDGSKRILTYVTRDLSIPSTGERFFPLTTAFQDGEWHTITRNFEQDAQLAYETGFVSIDYISFRGSVDISEIHAYPESSGQITVQGTVQLADDTPLEGQVVRAGSTNDLTLTNSTGFYQFTLSNTVTDPSVYTPTLVGAVGYTAETQSYNPSTRVLTQDFTFSGGEQYVIFSGDEATHTNWRLIQKTGEGQLDVLDESLTYPGNYLMLMSPTRRDMAIYRPMDNGWFGQTSDGDAMTRLTFDHDFFVPYYFQVTVNTTDGASHLLTYLPDEGVSGDLIFSLGEDSIGAGLGRTTFDRDLQEDLRTAYPDKTIESYRWIYIRGTAEIDNMILRPSE